MNKTAIEIHVKGMYTVKQTFICLAQDELLFYNAKRKVILLYSILLPNIVYYNILILEP